MHQSVPTQCSAEAQSVGIIPVSRSGSGPLVPVSPGAASWSGSNTWSSVGNSRSLPIRPLSLTRSSDSIVDRSWDLDSRWDGLSLVDRGGDSLSLIDSRGDCGGGVFHRGAVDRRVLSAVLGGVDGGGDTGCGGFPVVPALAFFAAAGDTGGSHS